MLAGLIDYIKVCDLETLDRQFLVERQLISREHSEIEGSRGVGIGSRENVSVMVNEEDHLRIQVLRSGFALDDCWAQINALMTSLRKVSLTHTTNRLGISQRCPTNVGTGIRVSVMLHLPALVLSKEIQKSLSHFKKATWLFVVCMVKAARQWATSTRFPHKSRWAKVKRNSLVDSTK